MDRTSDEKRRLIAQQRAALFKTVPQESKYTRARSQDGQPVTYRKVKEKSSITRHSRSMSDPEIPGTLVILNPKGLFQGTNGNYTQSRPESDTASVNIMDRPVFFDPSLDSKDARVHDLRKKFEAAKHDIVGDREPVRSCDFLNPLHKVNQDLANGNNEAKIAVKKKLEEALASTTQSTSALKPNRTEGTCPYNPKESEVKIEMPSRPPPRVHSRDHLKRCRGKSDPMPLDENRLSRMHACRQVKSLSEEVVQEENLPQQTEPETETVINANDWNGDGDGDEGDDDDDDDDDDFDDDDDEWDSDFDDEDDEQQKRDSQSSHGSSCDAEPLVSFCSLQNNFLILNFLRV